MADEPKNGKTAGISGVTGAAMGAIAAFGTVQVAPPPLPENVVTVREVKLIQDILQNQDERMNSLVLRAESIGARLRATESNAVARENWVPRILEIERHMIRTDPTFNPPR